MQRPSHRHSVITLSRRVLCGGAARVMLAATIFLAWKPAPALAQEITPSGTAVAPGFRLVAKVSAEEWMELPAASATPVAGEDLAGPTLLAALRDGGFILYFRHARTDFSQDDIDPIDLDNCATQRNLSQEGRAQARQIGEAISALAIPIGEVLSSELCRCRETAELAFGRQTPVRDISSFGTARSDEERLARVEALRRFLVTPPAPGANTVLVGHLFNIQDAAGINLAEGEAAIIVPLGSAAPAATPPSPGG